MTRETVISRITEVFARLESYLRLKCQQNRNDAALLDAMGRSPEEIQTALDQLAHRHGLQRSDH